MRSAASNKEVPCGVRGENQPIVYTGQPFWLLFNLQHHFQSIMTKETINPFVFSSLIGYRQ
jgi:hypothetical protein